MNLNKQIITPLFILLIAKSTLADLGVIPIYHKNLQPIEVQSNYSNNLDFLTPFSTEIYTSEDIESSNPTHLYDFLKQNTSLAIAPSSGNRFTQKIDMRGYGLSDGYQNIVITLNGRRLNNIDTSIQELSSISIQEIEKIEITKGSGSVVYGDSAMAGAIHIYTKKKITNTVAIALGNYGTQDVYFSAGLNQEKVNLSLSANNQKQDGYSEPDPQGNKDKAHQRNEKIALSINPNSQTEINFDYSESELDIRYPNYLTLNQFNQDPSQNSSGRVYTHQQTQSDVSNLKVISRLNPILDIGFHLSNQKKASTNSYYLWSDITEYDKPVTNNYDYFTFDYFVDLDFDHLKINTGITNFDGKRIAVDNITSKKNKGSFIQATYQMNNQIFTIGARNESIHYLYKPMIDTSKSASHQLEAYNLGVNHQISKNISIFTNYNSAFQSPLIDRFFNWDGSFNDFMNPAKSKTINLGINYLTSQSKTKVTLFTSKLTNEMYYFSDGFKNTNIDKSHKQGLELQHNQQINSSINIVINYEYIRAIIDEENEKDGAYNSKDLPGVSKNNLTFTLNYQPNRQSRYSITHRYRSKSYSEEDFENNQSQMQKAYQSTDIDYLYKPNQELSVHFSIENLFKQSYGTWLRDDVIYPSHFTRNFKLKVGYQY